MTVQHAPNRYLGLGAARAEQPRGRHQSALVQLDDDERRLIWLRFFEQHSQSEIAEEIGTSQMHVSRLRSRLMVKMRMIIGVPDTLHAAS